MIDTIFVANRTARLLKMEIIGHADTNPEKRLICCAASTLAYTMAQIVTDYQKTKKLAVKPIITDKKGHMVIEIRPKKKYYGLVKLHLAHTKRGFDMLHANYPEDVAETTYIDATSK